MGLFLEKTGCGETTSNGLCACGKLVKYPLQTGKNLYYTGPTLAGSGGRECDSINEVIQLMDAIILDLRTRVTQLEIQVAQLS